MYKKIKTFTFTKIKMDYKINFLFPSMSRPVKFFAALNNIKEMCLSEDWEVICILDQSDLTMNNQEVRKQISQYLNVKPFFINSTGKINAINQGVQYLSHNYNIMVLMADDIVFTEKGFDLHIISDMQQYWPELDGLCHYPDDISAAGERQITMPVMGRKLLEHFSYIYHPSYTSVYCDNEQLQVVKQIGKHKFIPTYFYSHKHPAFGKGENDNLYKRNESFYQIDSDNYFKRLAVNFDL